MHPSWNPKRKEVKLMEYTKPEVIVLDNAISAVQMSKLHGSVDNAQPTSQFPSIAAYQSDE
jgi:hypothetical protein